MAVAIKPAPVRKAVTVSVAQAKAFDVFTNGFGRWWPSAHSIGKSAQQSAIMEPRTGGRWYEIGEDGTQCDWGEVLVWEPPSRVLLAWRIGVDWRYDSALLTEVEIRFIPEGEQSTRVELEHRLLENLGAAGEAAREAYESDRGWSGILASYVAGVGDSPPL